MSGNNTKTISFCTVCMNRLHHIRETLPVNVRNNSRYGKVHFILLDYNSSDGLEVWVKEHMWKEIEAGKLIYYKTFEPRYFHRSHSRNMAFKLADGDVLCNIDADNFTGENFAAYLNDSFSKYTNAFFTAQHNSGKVVQNDVMGRVAVRRTDFYALRGYDECMSGYGYEDHDFISRLEMLQIERHVIDNSKYLQAITHQDSIRICNEYGIINLVAVLVGYINPSVSETILLFKDGLFERATIVDNSTEKALLPAFALPKELSAFEFQIKEPEWVKGTWEKDTFGNLILHSTGREQEVFAFHAQNGSYLCADNMNSPCFYQFNDPCMMEEIAFFHSQIANRIKWRQNQSGSVIEVNALRFGKGIVYKNFDYSSAIYI